MSIINNNNITRALTTATRPTTESESKNPMTDEVIFSKLDGVNTEGVSEVDDINRLDINPRTVIVHTSKINKKKLYNLPTGGENDIAYRIIINNRIIYLISNNNFAISFTIENDLNRMIKSDIKDLKNAMNHIITKQDSVSVFKYTIIIADQNTIKDNEIFKKRAIAINLGKEVGTLNTLNNKTDLVKRFPTNDENTNKYCINQIQNIIKKK